MSAFDLLIRGGLVAAPDGTAEVADVGVSGGVVAAVSPALEGGAAEIVDATGLLVLPGVVDAHVHLNDPGRADWEGFATGTAALAAGGTTCAVDMPLNASPPTVDGAAFDAKAAAARGVARVDVALWGGLVPGNLGALDELAERGVVGLKAFMSDSGIDDFAAVDEATLLDGMAAATRLGLPVAVHAESQALTAWRTAAARAAGRTGVADYLASRPVAAEVEAIGRAVAYAEATGCALHVVHVSSTRGVTVVAEARARGVDVTCETCPHYLLLDAEDAERLGAAAKCAPPLRPADEVARLLARVRAGDVDWVATDHSPAPAALKQSDDFFTVWGGIAGAQTLLTALLDLEVAPAQLAALLAGAPARRLGLAPAKGALTVGADADVVLADPAAEWTLERDALLDRHRLSPFAGRRFRGRPVRTVLRGRTIALGGRVVGEPVGVVVRRGG
jgi:allantoinase